MCHYDHLRLPHRARLRLRLRLLLLLLRRRRRRFVSCGRLAFVLSGTLLLGFSFLLPAVRVFNFWRLR